MYAPVGLSLKVTKPMLTGLNHLTLAVTDLNRSVAFYRDLLQLQLEATWDTGAYLSLPGLWLCLSLDPLRESAPAADYTHYAFSIGATDFPLFVERLRSASVREWRDNRSEGASFYFSRSGRAQARGACRGSGVAAGGVSATAVCGDEVLRRSLSRCSRSWDRLASIHPAFQQEFP